MDTELPALDSNSLARLVVEALERTAFVLADPCEEPEQLPAADTFAQIDFTGPASGTVELRSSRAFARNLAASILGADQTEISDLQSEEALRELANIVGGSVITALGGSDCRFSLGLPRLGQGGATGDDTACILDAEGERLEVHCHRAKAA
ncbi:MAG: Chemotaxis phosphatase CheX [Planctomycetota bacterium]|jgi:CheY-specific phosphatase CheX